ncbi:MULTISPECIES: hypothetical protein [Nocardiopsidaceae]|uniref:Abi-like protein n=2 Tax=Nocardiopsidaceae TaxID=83676 RepID=A0ABY6YJM5_9ACTN|nr:hypothetical protein [Streptomonospora nanhaiensis]WAE72452.1 hypothetical protein OUQ99_25110 [Streptomonospora nanhaiensis]
MSDDMPEWMYTVYSRPRLAPYITACDGDSTRAAHLYHWNVAVSAAFYRPLHVLELALRNSMHDRLCDRFGRADWWHAAPLHRKGVQLVAQARDTCLRRGSPASPDDIVTELSFGFWSFLLVSRYDRSLWRTALHSAFPFYGGPREDLRRQVDYLRTFRNRIMHHEPIHHRHLEADHSTIYRVLSWINPEAAGGIRHMDQVPEVLLVKEQEWRGVLPPSN